MKICYESSCCSSPSPCPKNVTRPHKDRRDVVFIESVSWEDLTNGYRQAVQHELLFLTNCDFLWRRHVAFLSKLSYYLWLDTVYRRMPKSAQKIKSSMSATSERDALSRNIMGLILWYRTRKAVLPFRWPGFHWSINCEGCGGSQHTY